MSIITNVELLIEDVEFDDENINEIDIAVKAALVTVGITGPIAIGYLIYRYLTRINKYKQQIDDINNQLKSVTDRYQKQALEEKLITLHKKLEFAQARARDERKRAINKMIVLKNRISEMEKNIKNLSPREKAELDKMKADYAKGSVLMNKINAKI